MTDPGDMTVEQLFRSMSLKQLSACVAVLAALAGSSFGFGKWTSANVCVLEKRILETQKMALQGQISSSATELAGLRAKVAVQNLDEERTKFLELSSLVYFHASVTGQDFWGEWVPDATEDDFNYYVIEYIEHIERITEGIEAVAQIRYGAVRSEPPILRFKHDGTGWWLPRFITESEAWH